MSLREPRHPVRGKTGISDEAPVAGWAWLLTLMRSAFFAATVLSGVAGSVFAQPTSIPGVVQAEAYDSGGEGVAYHDLTSGNSGGQLRSDDVDIFEDGEGGFYVGSIRASEWLAFSLVAPAEFLCQVRCRVAPGSRRDGLIRLEIDGATQSVLAVPRTSGATAWSNVVTARPFKILAGEQVAKIFFLSSSLNLDEIEFTTWSDSLPPFRDPEKSVEVRVSDLLGRMTDQEKIGQTCFVDRQFLTAAVPGDPAHSEADIRQWLLGGVFSGGGSAPSPNTVEAWADMVDRYQAYALSTRLGIPIIYGSDAVHGHSTLLNATILPHHIGQGATRDGKLVERLARVTARECVAAGVRWTFAPALSVPRNECWGRFYEGFGETPDLVTPLGVASIRGLQGTDLAASTSILACAKHYVADGGASWGAGFGGGIDQGNAVIDEATLRALHLAPFESAISHGCLSIMAALSSWRGEKLHGHSYLLNNVLKQELAFKGFVVSDWNGISALAPHSYLDAISISVNAGIDMNMIPDRYVQYSQNYQSAVASGRILRARLDDAARRILSVKFRLGLFDRPFAERSLIPRIRSPEHLAVAREAVRKSIVVLKNDNDILPLPKNLSRILVAGRHANNIGLQCGGWTITWQGTADLATAGTTILDAIKAAVSPETQVFYSSGGSGAAGADVAIVAIGEEPYAEFVGDTQNLLPKISELRTVALVQAAGVPVVVLLVSGRPLIVDPGIDSWDALAAVWLPGTEAQGIADVLFGDFQAVGRLPHSWPRALDDIPINIGDPNYRPLFPIGFGLSLRPSLTVNSSLLGAEDGIIFSWPEWASEYLLESTTPLSPSAVWNEVPNKPALVDNRWVVTNTPPNSGSLFYRLVEQ